MREDQHPMQELAVALDRDIFLRTLVRELSGILEDIIGYEEAAGYIALVGQSVGAWLNVAYGQALGTSPLSRPQVAEVLVDLKRRIQGGFRIVEQSDEKIVFRNDRCPFADKVLDRPSMCMMTSNVFGVIAAKNLGYAKVALHETIARRQPGCRVTVYLRETPESERAQGREYYGD